MTALSLVLILGATACREGPSVTTSAEAESLPRVDVARDPESAISTASTTDTTESTTTSESTTSSDTPSSSSTSSTASTETSGDPATTSSAASSPTSPSTQTTVTDDWTANSVSFVNQRRAQKALPTLQVDPALVDMAEDWARQMASDGQLRHNPSLRAQAPARYRSVGENVAYNSRPEQIDGMWWDSNGHRANILSASYSAIGVAFVQDSRGIYWAVQVFAG